MAENEGQSTHAVNPSNMLLTYQRRLNAEMEGRILAETAVDELLEAQVKLRNQISELQKAKEVSDLEMKTEIDTLRGEVNSLRDNL